MVSAGTPSENSKHPKFIYDSCGRNIYGVSRPAPIMPA